MAKVTEVKKVVGYVLELSDAEARTLRAVIGKVTGDRNDTARKYCDAIYNALTIAGVGGGSTEMKICGQLRADYLEEAALDTKK